MTDDRSDEVLEMYTEDERRDAAAGNGWHPDDPGPEEPSPDDLDETLRMVKQQRTARMNCEPQHDEPVPMTRAIAIPPFPVDALPKLIKAMVNAVSEATQTDPAMPATSALSTLSACTGGHAEIEIRSGWREPLCLYTATIAASGERKSAVTNPNSSTDRPAPDPGKPSKTSNWPPWAGCALAQHQAPAWLPQRHTASRVGSHVLRYETDQTPTVGNPVARASIRTRAIHKPHLRPVRCSCCLAGC